MGLWSSIRHGADKLTSGIKDAAGKVTKYTLGNEDIGRKFANTINSTANAPLMAIGKSKGSGAAVEEAPAEDGLDLSGVEESLAMMNEYLAAALKAAQKVEPAAEPLKAAQEEYEGAQADTNRLQLLRRGLMSTFTRYGGGLGGSSRQTLGA